MEFLFFSHKRLCNFIYAAQRQGNCFIFSHLKCLSWSWLVKSVVFRRINYIDHDGTKNWFFGEKGLFKSHLSLSLSLWKVTIFHHNGPLRHKRESNFFLKVSRIPVYSQIFVRIQNFLRSNQGFDKWSKTFWDFCIFYDSETDYCKSWIAYYVHDFIHCLGSYQNVWFTLTFAFRKSYAGLFFISVFSIFKTLKNVNCSIIFYCTLILYQHIFLLLLLD